MLFYLIESFDIYSTLQDFNSSSFSFFFIKFHLLFGLFFKKIFFYKVRFLVFLILSHALIIFYMNVKSIQKNILIISFIQGFNQNLKDTLFFKKINFLNWFFVLFFFIFFSNTLGLIPETIALNSIILVTLFLSFWMSFTYNFYGLSIKKEEWFNAFLPGNIPFAITPLLCAIEIVSYFIRIFSLAIRLFANILAGHILLHLLISYLSMMIKSFNFYLVIFSVIFGVLIFALTLLEWFMAFMQSAIFVLLLSMWFNENLI